MAEKRMFSKKITDSDAFIEMSSAAQSLYFHLNQGADDDGFNNQVRIAMMKSHASTDDLKVLLAKNFLIRFESGVIVIKHWRMHNTLRKDRYNPTNFQEELKQLGIKENGAYTLGCQVVAERLPDGCHSIEEISIDKLSKEREYIPMGELPPTQPSPQKSTRFVPPTVEEVKAYCEERRNNVDPIAFWNFYDGKGWMVGKSKMKNWKSAIITWEQREKGEAKKNNSAYSQRDAKEKAAAYVTVEL